MRLATLMAQDLTEEGFGPFLNRIVEELMRCILLNDKPIRVTSRATLPECILATGFYYDRGALMKRTLRQMDRSPAIRVSRQRPCPSAPSKL